MELLLSVSSIENLKRIKPELITGLIFGSAFSLNFRYSLNEMEEISTFCLNNGLSRYISVDTFIFEEDKVALYDYFAYLQQFNPDGIYFTDLGIIEIASQFGLSEKLIYDPDTLLTNSLDCAFYLKHGMGAVISRELNYDEITKILNNNPKKLDMQIFGHLKLSNSRRRFLTNYFNYLGRDEKVVGNKNLQIIEESRRYALPIVEDKYGTRIYSDFVFMVFKELIPLFPLIKRAIVSDCFIQDDDLIFSVLRSFQRMSLDNADFLRDSLIDKYRDYHFTNGYLYQKISLTKEENE